METKKGYLFCFCMDLMVSSAIEREKEVKERISLLYLSSFRRKKGWRKGGGRVEEGWRRGEEAEACVCLPYC